MPGLKETTAYKGEYLVITCPYCQHDTYLNVEDDPGEGFIPDSGRKMKCGQCGKTMLVTSR